MYTFLESHKGAVAQLSSTSKIYILRGVELIL